MHNILRYSLPLLFTLKGKLKILNKINAYFLEFYETVYVVT